MNNLDSDNEISVTEIVITGPKVCKLSVGRKVDERYRTCF